MCNIQLKSGDVIKNLYRLDKPIGKSAYGCVWKALDYRRECEVSIKMISIAYLEDSVKKHLLRERDLDIIMWAFESKLPHNNLNNIVPHTDIGIYRQWFYIVMPYYKYGSIISYLGKTPIKENQCWTLLHDISTGLSQFKQNGMSHNNIKPENVLIGDDGSFLLSGYGIECFINFYLRNSTNKALSVYEIDNKIYSAPELFFQSLHKTPDGICCDIWAVGTILYELISGGRPPFGANGGGAQLFGAKILDIEGDYSKDLKGLVYKCLGLHPQDRPSLEEIVSTSCERLSKSL